MDELLNDWLGELHWGLLIGLIVVCIAVLAWSAEWLVREAVVLSERSGVPKAVIGATVVSLGTTTPEVAVSVMAAIQGNPEMAVGNAAGSIICDTALVLGVACLVRPLPLPAQIIRRQSWVQFGSALLLVLASLPWAEPLEAFREGGGGRLSQEWGFAFLVLLAGYLWLSARWSKGARDGRALEELEVDVKAPLWVVLLKLAGAVALVILSSDVLIHTVRELAARFEVPEYLIAATLVAFGTSLPELVTGVTAARHGHGDLAVGNVVGADVLNALFVAGASAAVTPGGLPLSPSFFVWIFPTMLGLLIIFRIRVVVSGEPLGRRFGLVLLSLYCVYIVMLIASRVQPP